MSILGRSWLALSVVIATVQGVLALLALLALLPHDAILSDLVRQRLSVVAQTTAASFQPIVDLGLPLSMMRNGDAIVARALESDPTFAPVSPRVMQAMRLADGGAIRPSTSLACSTTATSPSRCSSWMSSARSLLRWVELVALELAPGSDQPPDVETIPARMAELHEQGVHWKYLGSSSFLYQNGELYTSAAVANGIAVVSPYESLVRDHEAPLSVAARYEDIGRLAAQQAVRILEDGATPGELPIAQATEFADVVNMAVARQLDPLPAVRVPAGRRDRRQVISAR